MNRRWRPSLGFVLGGALFGTLALALIGLIVFRYLGPAIGFRNAAILVGGVITLCTAVLGWLLIRLLLRPIHALEHYAQEIEQGHPDAEAPNHFGTQELRATARGVIAMAETLQDREATIRSYTDHVTHELKSPISAIRAAVELMQDSKNLTGEDRKLLGEIEGARSQAEDQLAALRSVARARETRYVGKATLRDLKPDLQKSYPTVQFEVEGGEISAPMSQHGLVIVLSQLIQNSVDHGADQVQLTASETGRDVEITIHDNGAGISQGNEARIFDPFFTTRRDAGGTGMGLAICRNILRAHGGEIALAPSARGAGFKIWFQAP